MPFRLFLAALVAAISGFLFGFDTVVINGTTDSLRQVYNLTEAWLGFTVASALIGTIIGAALAGKPADRIGRKSVLFWIGILYFVSAVGCGLAWDWYSLLFFRFIGGIGVGGASVVGPMYIAEISPAKLRGRLVALMQFNVVLGVFVALISNAVVARVCDSETAWRWMFAVEGFPAALFIVLVPLIPRSPRWLTSKGLEDRARRVFLSLGSSETDAAAEIAAIRESLVSENVASKEKLFQRCYLRPILLAVAIAAFNQLSGINAIMYYMSDIFQMAGASKDSALFQSCLIGAINLAATMAGLLLIDRFGRKGLMYFGSIGYILSLALITFMFAQFGDEFKTASTRNAVVAAQDRVDSLKASTRTNLLSQAEERLEKAQNDYQAALEKTGDVSAERQKKTGAVVLSALFFFVIAHAFGQGTVIWVYISEIFPNRVRARGQALGSFTHWFMAAVIAQSFPILVERVGGAFPFGFYAATMALQLLWVAFVMIETKGVPLEKIQKILTDSKTKVAE